MMNRRSFFTLSSIAAIGAASYDMSQTNSHYLLGWGMNVYSFPYRSIIGNLTGIGTSIIKVNSKTHSFLKKENDLVFSIPKWGNKIDLINIQENLIISTLQADSDLQFMGHGLIHNNELFISAIELSPSSSHYFGKGRVLIYDLNTLTLKRKLDSYGFEPHELIKYNNQLIVLNSGMNERKSGGESNISHIDIESGDLIHQINSPKGIHFAHLQKISEKEIFLTNEYPEGDDDNEVTPYYYHFEKGLFNFEKIPKTLNRGNLLSLASDGKYIVATLPEDNLLAIWNIKTKKLIKKVHINNPKSINYIKGEKRYIIGASSGVFSLDTLFDLKQLISVPFSDQASSHAHLTP